jgi:hypothetical protein
MATTPYPYARFIGRVGGLAVALGIGVAIANGAATASADDGQQGSSESSSAKSESSNSGSSSSDSSSSNSASSNSASEASKSSDSTSVESSGDDDNKKKKRTPRETVSTDSSPTASSNDDEKSSDTETSGSHEDQDEDQDGDRTSSSDRESSKVADTSTDNAAQSPAAETTISQPLSAATSAVTTQSVSTAAVSPLGTPEQLAAETVNTLPVQLMKLVLQFGWLSTAQREFSSVGGPDAENIAQLNRSVDEYAVGAAFQQQLLNPMTPTVVTQVAPPHTWYGQTVGGSRILYDNPDTIYRFMAVNETSTYVITGRFAGGIPADTNFSVLTGLSGVTAANLSGRDLVVNPDGTFTITVSGAPAAPGQKNHLQLTSDSSLIAVRNTLSDWNTQEPMSLSIQRVGGPPNSLFGQLGGFAIPFIGPLVTENPLLTTLVSLIPPLPDPPPLLRGAVTAVIMALGLQMESRYIAVATTDPTTGQRRKPNVLPNPTRNAEFLATQLQSAGYFQLTDQQALVVTINPGNARYFVVPVTNDWTITENYWDQQTSLNNAQAVANPDGTYTLVISPTDPGVRNWVSTGGLNQGTISIRFQDLDPNSTALPTVRSQVVSLDQLPTVLPTRTVYVTPQQREDAIKVRKAGFNKRFAPYPQP